MEDRVPFTEKDIKLYLDGCIKLWREKRDYTNGLGIKEVEERELAPFYIDAYQSVRTSLFNELLEK